MVKSNTSRMASIFTWSVTTKDFAIVGNQRFYTGIVIQWTKKRLAVSICALSSSLMYALLLTLPFHLRAGAAVCCGCSLLTGENNIDDEPPLFGGERFSQFGRADLVEL